MLYLNLFCASIRKMCPEVIASSLDAILVYEKFHRNALLSESGKISIRTSDGRRGTDFFLCFLFLLFLKIKNLGIYFFSNFKINTIVLLTRLGLQLYITGFIYSTT